MDKARPMVLSLSLFGRERTMKIPALILLSLILTKSVSFHEIKLKPFISDYNTTITLG
jgi:hypothetical protein